MTRRAVAASPSRGPGEDPGPSPRPPAAPRAGDGRPVAGTRRGRGGTQAAQGRPLCPAGAGEPGVPWCSPASPCRFFPQARRSASTPQEFQALAEAALAGTRSGRGEPGGRRCLPRRAICPHDPYEPWAEDARDRLRLLYLDVLRLCGPLGGAARPSTRPTRKLICNVIARWLAQANRRAALRQFERLERALRQELGVAPSPAAVDFAPGCRRAERIRR